MGFFKDFKDDFSQAVGELFPGDDFEDEETIQVNTLDNELDVEQELSKLDGLLEQVERKVVARNEARMKTVSEPERKPQLVSEDKPEPETERESKIEVKPDVKPDILQEPEQEPVKVEPEPELKEEPEKKETPESESELAPLVFDEPMVLPEEKPMALRPEEKSEEKPTVPKPIMETPKPEEKPMAQEPKSTITAPVPEEKSTVSALKSEEKPVASAPKSEEKPMASALKSEERPMASALKSEERPMEPKTEPTLVVQESAALMRKSNVVSMPKSGPVRQAKRIQPVVAPDLSNAPEKPAAAWGSSTNHMQINRSVNIKEEKSMDTTVTATETPVVETAAETVAVPNEPMAPPVEVTDEVSLITAGTSIKGNMETTGSFEIEGKIEGDIKCNGKLTVIGTVVGNSASSEFFADAAHIEGEVVSSGTVKIGLGSVIIGNISATSAVIAGAVKGDIDVQGPVVVDTSAVIMGNIKSRSVQINNGAVIEGFCSQCYSDVDVESLFNKN